MITKKFLEQQQAKLEREKKDIENLLKKITEDGRKPKISDHLKIKYPQWGFKEEENAEEVEEFLQNVDLEGHLEDILRGVQRALDKIKKGKYGICEVCGGKIKKARLEAFPAATLCVDCQAKKERR